ncbi:MAG: SpaH/EbpB family LPXTG-anchored major pilin [Oscillospiraceae bacterium]|nr:SpaH/EbpB family LPXTG-anchored major pilin [Oscillospiraceae bacterium]
MSMGISAFAETSTPSITVVPNNTAADTESLAINYTYYQILEASIDTDPVVDQATGAATTAGTVAYYVTTEDRATQLTNTNLFNVTKVDGQNKWYVELKSTATTAQQIIDAFEANTFDLTKFPTGTFDKTAAEAQAESGTLAAGYYYITSSLGTKAAVETLTAVTINEKNTYPSNTKTDDKEYAAIDDTVTYTVTVTIPESVASKPITIVDTITDGLTLNTAVTVTGAVEDPAYTSATFVAGTHTAGTAGTPAVEDDPETPEDESAAAVPATQGTTVYTLEIPAATVLANKGKTLTFTYTAKVNENAVVLEKEHNKAHITYDNFTTVDVDTDVTTLAFDVQKVDGTDKTTVLAGAEFKLYDAATEGNEIPVVLKEAASDANGQVSTYRVAKDGETGVVMTGGTFRIEGLDNKTYYLEETKAPTGYNKLETRIEAAASTSTAPATNIDYKVENNKGATLPSTGGIGTTIFYVVGSILVVAAGVLLITKKRMSREG